MTTNSIRLEHALIEKASIIAKALDRTTAEQIEHWVIVGEMMEENPDLPYELAKQAIDAKAECEAGALRFWLKPPVSYTPDL